MAMHQHEFEPFVNATQAEKILGVSSAYLWAVKKAMAEDGHPVRRKFLVSVVRQWILDHPHFRSKSQKGDKTFLREVLEVLKSPRHGQRQAVIAKLEKMLQSKKPGG